MLILTRRPGESFYIDDDIQILVMEMNEKRGYVRIGIDAPIENKILREELIGSDRNKDRSSQSD